MKTCVNVWVTRWFIPAYSLCRWSMFTQPLSSNICLCCASLSCALPAFRSHMKIFFSSSYLEILLLWATNCDVTSTYPYHPPTVSHIMHPSPPLTQTQQPPSISPLLFIPSVAWLDMLVSGLLGYVWAHCWCFSCFCVLTCMCLWREECVHFTVVASHNIGEFPVPPLDNQAKSLSEI
jgi:hypothetical protein